MQWKSDVLGDKCNVQYSGREKGGGSRDTELKNPPVRPGFAGREHVEEEEGNVEEGKRRGGRGTGKMGRGK